MKCAKSAVSQTKMPGLCDVLMAINGDLEVMVTRSKIRSRELAEKFGNAEQNVSLLQSGKIKGIRFDTPKRICAVLNCQPGDIFEVAQTSRPRDPEQTHHSSRPPMIWFRRAPARRVAGQGRNGPARSNRPEPVPSSFRLGISRSS